MLAYGGIVLKMNSLSNLVFKTNSNGILFDKDFILKRCPKSEHLRGMCLVFFYFISFDLENFGLSFCNMEIWPSLLSPLAVFVQHVRRLRLGCQKMRQLCTNICQMIGYHTCGCRQFMFLFSVSIFSFFFSLDFCFFFPARLFVHHLCFHIFPLRCWLFFGGIFLIWNPYQTWFRLISFWKSSLIGISSLKRCKKMSI